MNDEYVKQYKSARAIIEICVTILEGIALKTFIADINEAENCANVDNMSDENFKSAKRAMLKDRKVFKAAQKFIDDMHIEFEAADIDEAIPEDDYPHDTDPAYN